MSIELIPNNPRCHCIGLANDVWFTILRESLIGDVIGRKYNNDPLRISRKAALHCAEILLHWQPPQNWYYGCSMDGYSLKSDLVEFFKNCNGFITS